MVAEKKAASREMTVLRIKKKKKEDVRNPETYLHYVIFNLLKSAAKEENL